MLFSSQNSSDGSFLGEQELISFTGEPIDISFNIRYLQDFINSMTGEVLWFGCNDAVMPAAFRDLVMGSNMQRQAVPLLVTEAPVVGTGKIGRAHV